MPPAEIVTLVLTAVLASIPVALPATFTLAAALGARALARQGVLLTRLSAVDEAATMDVLCADKTGTLTRNELTVTAVRPMAGFDEAHVLGMAVLASSDGGQDPVDAAIRAAAAGHGAVDLPSGQVRSLRSGHEDVRGDGGGCRRHRAADREGGLRRGRATRRAVAGGCRGGPELEAQGFRVLAVAAGPPTAMRLVGFIALSDPPGRIRRRHRGAAHAWASAP